MAKNRSGSKEIKGFVDTQIVLLFGKQFPNQFNFINIFRQMRLHEGIGIFSPETAGSTKLFRRGCRSKTRRNSIYITPLFMPFLQQLFGKLVASFSGLQKVFRCISVHHYLTTCHPKSELGSCLKERIYGLRVDRREHRRSGSTVCQTFFEKRICYFTGVLFIPESTFSGKSITFQPLQ